MNIKLIRILFVLVVMGTLLVPGCKQSGDSMLTLSKAQWKLVHLANGSDEVHLQISGATTGFKVTVKIFGDGWNNNQELPLNEEKKFTKYVVIVFSYVPYATHVKFTTVVTAYANDGMVSINLSSGDLY